MFPMECIMIMEMFEDENFTDGQVTTTCAKFKPLKNYHIILCSNSTLINWYALYGRIVLLNIGVCMCNWNNYRIQWIGGTSYGVLAFLHQLPHHNSLYQQVATYTHSHVIVHVTWPCPINVTVLITPTMLAMCVYACGWVRACAHTYVPACVLCEYVWVLMCSCMPLQVCMRACTCERKWDACVCLCLCINGI